MHVFPQLFSGGVTRKRLYMQFGGSALPWCPGCVCADGFRRRTVIRAGRYIRLNWEVRTYGHASSGERGRGRGGKCHGVSISRIISAGAWGEVKTLTRVLLDQQLRMQRARLAPFSFHIIYHARWWRGTTAISEPLNDRLRVLKKVTLWPQESSGFHSKLNSGPVNPNRFEARPIRWALMCGVAKTRPARHKQGAAKHSHISRSRAI